MNTEQKITEQEISTLVDRFYAKVRLDQQIGPIFNAIVDNWPHHLALLKDFWSTVLLTTGRYKGQPLMTHLQLPLDPEHFERWLTLFAETATEVLPPPVAANVIAKSQRIAENFKLGIAHQQAKDKPGGPDPAAAIWNLPKA
jgi:hemoglobin